MLYAIYITVSRSAPIICIRPVCVKQKVLKNTDDYPDSNRGAEAREHRRERTCRRLALAPPAAVRVESETVARA
jgi:hypothetical protein